MSKESVAVTLSLGLLLAGVMVFAGVRSKNDFDRARHKRIVREVKIAERQKDINVGLFFPDEPGSRMIRYDSEPSLDEWINLSTHRIGVAWYRPLMAPECEDKRACQYTTDKLCRDAGHCGVDKDSVKIVEYSDYGGGAVCSGDCTCDCPEQGGCPTAFVTCPSESICDEPDPVGEGECW